MAPTMSDHPSHIFHISQFDGNSNYEQYGSRVIDLFKHCSMISLTQNIINSMHFI